MKHAGRFLLVALCLLAISSSAFAATKASNKVKIGVAGFEIKTNGVTDMQVAVITDFFTTELTQSKFISVVERAALNKIGAEMKLGMSGLADASTAAKVGKLAGVKYMLLGSVTHFKSSVSGNVLQGIGGSANTEARIELNMRVVNVETGEIISATKKEGRAKNSAAAFQFAGITVAEAQLGGIEVAAIAEAVSRLSWDVRGTLFKEYPTVISETVDGGFVIDVVAPKEGKDGSVYLVYADGKTLTKPDGTVLGREKIYIAILKVSKVETGYSVARVVDKAGFAKNIQPGDKLEFLSNADAKTYIGKLPKERPGKTPAKDLLKSGAKGANAAPPGGDERAAVTAPVSTAPAQPKAVAGVDPNKETGAKLVDTYQLSDKDRRMRGIQHRGAWGFYSQGNREGYQKALEAYKTLAESYDGDYLAMYRAGMSALNLRDKKTAAEWFDRALSVNPDYEPARTARDKIK